MSERKGVVLHDEYAGYFNVLPDADAASLIRGMLEYSATGEMPQSLTLKASIAFIAIKQIMDSDNEE